MQEHRRILWNTYRNLELWFNTWEDNLVELGFAKFDEETKACKVHDNQLARILNIDESACSVDGANGQRGGRKLQLECHGILRHVGPGPPKKPNADQLKLLLKWQGLEVKRYKPENEATWESFFSDFDNWEALPNRVAERWTAQDERELEALDDYSTITMNDTALQLKIDESKRDLRMAAAKMDEEECAEILAIFARGDRAESSSAAAAASANNNEAAEDDSAPCSC
jgi:hypothetical protein